MVENRKAGMANNALPIQMAMMIPATTYFDVRIFKGQTMALYLETKQKRVTWVQIIRQLAYVSVFGLPIQWHGGEIEYRRRYRHDSHEIVDGTVSLSKVPSPVPHGHVVETAV